ncbi:hypothetical protein P3L10_015004 [Capsicum annuum]
MTNVGFFWQNMWDLTPDTDLLKELPEEYTFETTLADLINNSLQAVWSNYADQRRLIKYGILYLDSSRKYVISVKCQPSGVGLGLVVIGLSFGVLPFKVSSSILSGCKQFLRAIGLGEP